MRCFVFCFVAVEGLRVGNVVSCIVDGKGIGDENGLDGGSFHVVVVHDCGL